MARRILIVRCLSAWRADGGGATAIEYALIAGAIALALVVAILAIGGDLKTLYATFDSIMEGVISNPTT